MITERELARKQNEAAQKFFKRLKENFDFKKFDKSPGANTEYSYAGWIFRGFKDNHVFEIYMSDPAHRFSNKKIYIRGSNATMRRIKRYILKQWKQKCRYSEIQLQIDELSPTELAIEKTFNTDATETFDALNR